MRILTKCENRKILHIFLIVLFSYLFLLHGIWSYSLKEPDEGRYAEIPREMLELGEYLVPHLNYLRYFEKPPLFYWVVAFSYKLFGVTEFSFRLPNAIFALLSVLSTYFFSVRLFDEKVALYSSLILLSSFGFFSMSRIVTLDMAFSTLLIMSLFSFGLYYGERKRKYLWLFYVFLGAATLAKGFASFVLLGITILIFLLSERNIGFLKGMEIKKGLTLCGLIVAPYFTYMSIKEEGFFYFFFIDQHILRYLTEKHRRAGPVYYFFPVLFGGMFPYSLIIPRTIYRLWAKKEARLLIVWTFSVFLFFSLSGSKLPPYILPIFPTLSVLIATFISQEGKKEFPYEKYAYAFLFVSIVFLLHMIHIILPQEETLKDILSRFRTFTSLVTIFFFFISLYLVVKKLTLERIFLTLLFSSIFIMLLILSSLKELDEIRTQKPIALRILSERKGDELVINYGAFDETLLFYLRSKIIIASYMGELEFGLRGAKWQAYMDEKKFVETFNSHKKVFCVANIKRMDHMVKNLKLRPNFIMCTRERCLVKNF